MSGLREKHIRSNLIKVGLLMRVWIHADNDIEFLNYNAFIIKVMSNNQSINIVIGHEIYPCSGIKDFSIDNTSKYRE